MALTPEQRQIVQLAISKSQGASQRVRRSLLEALAVESSFRNLPYGDRDSQGVLQQRPSQGWGAPGNPAQDIGQYLTKAETLDRSGFQGTAGQLAQAVQRSAFPGRYDQHRGEAISLLNQFGGSSGGTPSPMTAAAPTQVGADPRRQIALALLDPKLRENPLALIQTIKGLRDQGSAGPPVANPMVGSQQTAPQGGGSYFRIAAGADRPGVSLRPQVLNFVGELGRRLGHPLTIGTGTNHNQFVLGTHRQSEHWTGNAADIPASGKANLQIGREALIQAGMNPAKAMTAPGGIYNLGNVQVIFGVSGVQYGGNHLNHVHVSVK